MKYKLPVLNGINFGVIGAVGTGAFFFIVNVLQSISSDPGVVTSLTIFHIPQMSWAFLIGSTLGFLIGLIVEFVFRNKDNSS